MGNPEVGGDQQQLWWQNNRDPMPKYSMQSMVATKSDMILILIYDRVLIRIEFYKTNVLLGKTHVELHLLCFQKLVLL